MKLKFEFQFFRENVYLQRINLENYFVVEQYLVNELDATRDTKNINESLRK
jgi:hypothetical protein